MFSRSLNLQRRGIRRLLPLSSSPSAIRCFAPFNFARFGRFLLNNGCYHGNNSSHQHGSNNRTIFFSTGSNSHQDKKKTSATTDKDDKRFVSILENQDLIQNIPLQDVRNFCFIAHIDHGKSSLSSRVLELTGNLGREAQEFAWNSHTIDSSSSTDKNNNNIHDSSKSIRSSGTGGGGGGGKERIEALDTLAVEQQRGITVKATTATMLYRHASAVGPTGTLLINMYDTPGHVDFGREVTRSLAFVQGAVLLLDATQGIQAQTWSVYEKAKAIPEPNKPTILFALTKIDLDSARPDHCALTLCDWLGLDDPEKILHTSARNRIGVKELLDAVCEQVPPPRALPDDDANDDIGASSSSGSEHGLLRAQVVDSWYDALGVNCLVRIVSGELKEGMRISIVKTSDHEDGSDISSDDDCCIIPMSPVRKQSQQTSYPVQEVGIVLPHTVRTSQLRRGQLGYVRFGLRDPRQALPGTILMGAKHAASGKNLTTQQPILLPRLPGGDHAGSAAKSVLYASVHPTEEESFDDLCNAVDRLALNDTGLEIQKTSSTGDGGSGGGPFLGPGLKVGFQGLLHVEVFRQRLLDEFDMDAVVTPPKVPYEVTLFPKKTNNLEESCTKVIEDLSEWPESGATRFTVKEPIVNARVIARVEDAGAVMELFVRKRGTNIASKPIDEEKWSFTATLPWAEVVTDFHDHLKNVSQGYASMDTSEAGYAKADLCKVEVMLNSDVVEPLAFVCHKDAAQAEARVVCQKLQQVLPRQQFVTVIQAKADGRIIAAERIKAFRKDVLTKSGKTVGGGDQTRKMKLLEKQKKGKKRMQSSGKVQLSQAAFNSVISRSS